jgi:hypothetical protein
MAGNIDQVIADLEGIVADCLVRSDRAGYFAAMYLAVTKEIEAAVDGSRFEDGPRRAALDQIFAQRYIDAFRTNQAGRTRPTWVGVANVDGVCDQIGRCLAGIDCALIENPELQPVRVGGWCSAPLSLAICPGDVTLRRCPAARSARQLGPFPPRHAA